MIALLGGVPRPARADVPSIVMLPDALPIILRTPFRRPCLGWVFGEKVQNKFRKSTDSAPMGGLTV